MSLLSHLLTGSGKEELYATTALNYLLCHNPQFREALVANWAQQAQIDLPPALTFRSEVQAGEGWCDIAGIDAVGQVHVLIEGKFWAALTENQPGSYLEALANGGGGLLMFVAPAIRTDTLWPEILRRAQGSGHQVMVGPTVLPHLRFVTLKSGHTLALTSWGAVLNFLEAEGIKAADAAFVSDVRQLEALCARMDVSGFLPLTPTEMTCAVGRRYAQLRLLLDDLQQRLFAAGMAAKNPGTIKSTEWWHLLLSDARAYLRFWIQGWSTHRETPCWLAIPRSGERLLNADQFARIERLDHEHPSRLIKESDYWLVPLYPKLGVERHDVLLDMLEQVRGVANLIAQDATPLSSPSRPSQPAS